MAEIMSFPNNADEYIGAEEVMHWLHGRTSGVYAGSGNAAVTAVQNSMSVSVAPGIGWIADSASNGVCWWFDSAVTLDVDSAEATGTLNRIDRVIVEWPTTDYADKPEVKILKGTSASSAVAPALTNNSTKRQISLARITIPAGTTSLTSENIIDERLDPTVCGLVTETVTADTSMIAAQYDEAIQTLYNGIAQAWEGQISDGAITRKKLSNDQMRTYTSVTQLGLTSGSATLSDIKTALPTNSKLICPTTELASGTVAVDGSLEVVHTSSDYFVNIHGSSGDESPRATKFNLASASVSASGTEYTLFSGTFPAGLYLFGFSVYLNINMSGVTTPNVIRVRIWAGNTVVAANQHPYASVANAFTQFAMAPVTLTEATEIKVTLARTSGTVAFTTNTDNTISFAWMARLA